MSERRQPKIKEIAPGEIRTVCWGCEKPIRGGRGRAIWCDDCHPDKPKRKSSGRKLKLFDSDREQVERLWAKGLSIKEIAKVVELDTRFPDSALSYARAKRGWDLPYRQPDKVARARKLGKEHGRFK